MVECMVFMQNMVLQGLCKLLLLQAAIGQIRAFVANLIFVANTHFFPFETFIGNSTEIACQGGLEGKIVSTQSKVYAFRNWPRFKTR